MKEKFHLIAQAMSNWMGSAWAFALAFGLILTWLISGPIFGYSDTWQLLINTSTTIITFLMVFLIQNTQNRDNKALQLKLDELIRVNAQARNKLLDLEDLSEEELNQLHEEFCRLQKMAKDHAEDIEEIRSDLHEARKDS